LSYKLLLRHPSAGVGVGACAPALTCWLSMPHAAAKRLTNASVSTVVIVVVVAIGGIGWT
jgi:hypothetical protein